MKAISASILALAGATLAAGGAIGDEQAFQAVGCLVGFSGLVAWIGAFFFMGDVES